MTTPKLPGADTVAVHGASVVVNPLRTIPAPLALASTFHFGSIAEARDVVEKRSDSDDYARYANPTVRIAEARVAALDRAEECALFGSGMAALTTTMLALLSPGQHVVLGAECYRPAEQFITQTLARFGVESTRVDNTDVEAFAAAIRPGATRMIFVETPSNPHQRIADLPALAALRKQHRGVQLVVDATLSTPLNQRPLELGADLVIHSATKYLAGHNDLLAGAVCGRAGLVGVVRDLRSQLGGILDPHAAFLLVRGLKSFAVRMRQHNTNALTIARWLEAHPRVRRVWYAGLESHPDFARASAQMSGFGGLMAFEHDGDFAFTERFCDRVRLFQIAASLGGTESLLHPPALFSYWDMAPEERQARGFGDNLVRLAIGIESSDDLIADLEQALIDP
jgi:cystathionine gamma-synthase